jgi:pyruvate dehydrogenase E2 component (dihydrolipoamide acetyltransferase)
MAIEIIMPKVDMVMDTGTFVEWLKQEGEWVEKGEPLFVILTDKANIEVEAPASGVLAGATARPDDVIPVAEVIGYLLAADEKLPQAGPEAAAKAASLETPAAAGPGAAPVTREPAAAAMNGAVRATPAARVLAKKLGIDLAQVEGRGPRQRIHKRDVLEFVESQAPAAVPPAAALPLPAARPELALPLPEARIRERFPLRGPRAIIARRMSYSAATAPHITESLSVDMSEAARLRQKVSQILEQQTGQRVSYTAILAHVVAQVLTAHPYLNSSLSDDEIILWDDVHLGIAMSLKDYLIVPVIRQAQQKNLAQMVQELGRLVDAAQHKRLEPAEMSGSTFTISNLGMFGIESFTAIINPPESAILAVGKIMDTPVVVDKEIVVRPMMNLTISADHRVIDGATAANFLQDLKRTLENPYLLI